MTDCTACVDSWLYCSWLAFLYLWTHQVGPLWQYKEASTFVVGPPVTPYQQHMCVCSGNRPPAGTFLPPGLLLLR